MGFCVSWIRIKGSLSSYVLNLMIIGWCTWRKLTSRRSEENADDEYVTLKATYDTVHLLLKTMKLIFRTNMLRCVFVAMQDSGRSIPIYRHHFWVFYRFQRDVAIWSGLRPLRFSTIADCNWPIFVFNNWKIQQNDHGLAAKTFEM